MIWISHFDIHFSFKCLICNHSLFGLLWLSQRSLLVNVTLHLKIRGIFSSIFWQWFEHNSTGIREQALYDFNTFRWLNFCTLFYIPGYIPEPPGLWELEQNLYPVVVWKLHYVELVHSVFQVYYIPGGSDGKESGCSEGDPGSIRKSERCPGEGKDNPLQYACLENSMDRGAWRATVHGGHRVGHD